MDSINAAIEIMKDFAESTGLSNSEAPPRRYLWTDAFAVCNFLEIFHKTRDEGWLQTALKLVDQVHFILGRHRKDDAREGWISGLKEHEGKRHPTIGGLRIGKQINERGFDDPFNEHDEWERDGQYYHYLTKWMHALNRVSRETKDPVYNQWAMELAMAAHSAFVHTMQAGSKRMFWKMSIDLSYPLVSSMGHHDPLDGWITYEQLRTTALEFSEKPNLRLDSEISDMRTLCASDNWATDDPLGIGGLLCDAYRVFLLSTKGRIVETNLLNDLLEASSDSLDTFMARRSLAHSAYHRLAFRELGLTIGIHAIELMRNVMNRRRDDFPGSQKTYTWLDRLSQYDRLSEAIEKFWLEPGNRSSQTWTDHKDINSVMLATSLAPDGFLDI
jgi:hypothetical protein